MKYFSDVVCLGPAAPFPEFMAEKVYMVPFTKKDGLPKDLLRWSDLVESMLDNVVTDEKIFLMIDQSIVPANSYHRRPGVHIDGYWNELQAGHGGNTHGSTPSRGGHGSGKWAPVPVTDKPTIKKKKKWSESTFSDKEGIILASNVTASQAYHGPFDGPIGENGDCSEIELDDKTPISLAANEVWAGNVTMLHETLCLPVEVVRTVVRLNVPGWHP